MTLPSLSREWWSLIHHSHSCEVSTEISRISKVQRIQKTGNKPAQSLGLLSDKEPCGDRSPSTGLSSQHCSPANAGLCEGSGLSLLGVNALAVMSVLTGRSIFTCKWKGCIAIKSFWVPIDVLFSLFIKNFRMVITYSWFKKKPIYSSLLIFLLFFSKRIYIISVRLGKTLSYSLNNQWQSHWVTWVPALINGDKWQLTGQRPSPGSMRSASLHNT